jgi:membrane protein implicated in regulation of membrane protease activity
VRAIGPVLIAAGLVCLVAGLLAWSGLLSWFGRLPGDLRVERPGFRPFLPLVSVLLVSLALSLLLAILRRFR